MRRSTISMQPVELLVLAADVRNDHCGGKAGGAILLTNRLGAKGPPPPVLQNR
jgi:hypothetical protein